MKPSGEKIRVGFASSFFRDHTIGKLTRGLIAQLSRADFHVTLFSVGHSITLLTGVLFKLEVNVYLIDAVIGLSVAYKAFDNLGGFQSVFGVQPNNKIAVAGFGLIHGFGLATKLQSLRLNPSDSSVVSSLAFHACGA